MKLAHLALPGLSLVISFSALAQTTAPTELVGGRFVNSTIPAADTNATFAVGMTLNEGLSYRNNAQISDDIRIVGQIRPEAAHIGQKADIFVVDRVNLAFKMRNQDGVFVDWNGRVPDLVPYLEDVTLTADYAVNIFQGKLGATGDHRLFIGYLPESGGLRYTPVPQFLAIIEDTADAAFAMFASTISPDIVHSRCIACHVNGGLAQAGGAYHIFQQPLTAALQTNFDIFNGLVALRGVEHILTKVRGGNSHGGGVQMTEGSVEYDRLREFLDLLASGLPAPGGGGDDEEEPVDPYDPYVY